MKHVIDALPGSDEFRKQFCVISDAFVSTLERVAANHAVDCFRACDLSGQPISWVWEDSDFAHTLDVGTVEDAKSFASNMIGQGMCFAFMIAQRNGEKTGWLTTWECPEEGPVWPAGATPILEELHEGVLLSRKGE